MKGKAFNLHLSCYSLDRFTSPQKDNKERYRKITSESFFSHYRGKDNLTSNMMGEVMRQVLRPGNRKKSTSKPFSTFLKRMAWWPYICIFFRFLNRVARWPQSPIFLHLKDLSMNSSQDRLQASKTFWRYHKELLSLSSCAYVCVLMNHCASGGSSTQGSL